MRPTLRAVPLPYSKVRDTFRPPLGQTAARGADLGAKRFVHFREAAPCVIAFVGQHRTEGRPAGVKNGFSHSGFGQLGRRDIADDHVVKRLCYAGRKFVVEVAARVLNMGVNVCCLFILAGALRLRQLIGQLREMARVLYLFPGGKNSKITQPKVDTDGCSDFVPGIIGKCQDHINKPVPLGIPRKIRTIPDNGAIWDRTGIEDSEGIPSKDERFAFSFEVAALERHPPQGFLSPPAKGRPLLLFSALGVLFANRIDSSRMDAKFLAGPHREIVEVDSSKPSLAEPQTGLLAFVAKVPDVIDRSRLTVENLRRSLDTIAVN